MLGSGGVLQNPPLNLFSDSYQQLPQNKLTIRLQPDEGIEIQVLNKVPGLDHKHRLQTTKLDLSFSETFNRSTWRTPTSACCWRPCAAFRRCSCAAMKWKKHGSGSTPSWTHGKPTTRRRSLIRRAHGAGGLGGDDHPRRPFPERVRVMRNAGSLSAGFCLRSARGPHHLRYGRTSAHLRGALWQGRAIVNRE